MPIADIRAAKEGVMWMVAGRIATVALIVWAFGAGTAFSDSVLVAQLRTDYEPGSDFDTVIVTARDASSGLVKERVAISVSSLRINWPDPVRVAELHLKKGDYYVMFVLSHRRLGIRFVAQRELWITLEDGVRVVTVVIRKPSVPTTERHSAPGDPPPLPQAKSPAAKSPSGAASRIQPLPSDRLSSNLCHDSVQGRIAFDYHGNKYWVEANINRLCKGAETSSEPARCFQKVMHGGVSNGHSTRWRWQDALELCAGARNHRSRILCFQAQIQRGASLRSAIFRCKNA